MQRVYCIAMLFLVWLFAHGVSAQNQSDVDKPDFETKQQEELFDRLAFELRCLVCQNQNIADSNAELAVDLRREIYTMVSRGDSRSQIIDFMVARYGEFVLYRPRMNATTVALWAGPFVFFALGLFFVYRMARKRPPQPAAATDPSALQKARRLLDEDHG